jgi:outer membrane protein OmpU
MNWKTEGKIMKKILFATTALVATAGVAAADVSFGGYARFGVDYNDSRATEEVRMTSRFRLIVTASAESDNGLSFGAQIRYQADANEDTYKITSFSTITVASSTVAASLGKAGFNTPRFWVSTGGLTVSVGHVMGAFEYMPGMYAGSVGLTGLGYGNRVDNFGSDNYTSGASGRFGFDVVYSAGAFGVHLTHTFDDAYLAASNVAASRTALVASYAMGDYTFALGLQDSDVAATDADWAFTAGGTFGAVDLTLQVADNGTNDTKYGIAGNYNMSAATSIQGYINVDTRAAFDAPGGEDMNMGLGFVHNMGGGTSLRGGVASLAGAAGNTVRADLGLLFSF